MTMNKTSTHACCIITGGGSGLGYSIAAGLAAAGKTIVITGRDAEKLAASVSAIKGKNPQAAVEYFAADITSEAAVKSLFKYVEEIGCFPEQLYNVAGCGYFGELENIRYGDIEKVMGANLIGLMLMTIQAVHHMKKSPAGRKRIISVLSTAALGGKKNETIYYAAKWGARGFIESVKDELRGSDIELLTAYPGGMNTPFWNGSSSGYDTGSFMDPEDVAAIIIGHALDNRCVVSDITINRPR